MPSRPSPIHRLLGLPVGPLTSEIVDQAIAAGVRETDDLDWKQKLPNEKALKDSDFAKDVAAMANAKGGLIVYGVTEDNITSAASGRLDVGEVTDGYERTMRRVAATIRPPVFGLEFVRLGDDGQRCLALGVAASHDAPHLIYYNDLFGAPRRNGAATHWMLEWEVDQAYRLRHERRRRAEQELAKIYAHTASYAHADPRASARVWLVGVARPAADQPAIAVSRQDARDRLKRASEYAIQHAGTDCVHPLDCGNTFNPRVGLRRWVAAMNRGDGRTDAFREAWAELHHDGTVPLAAAMGGGPGSAADERLGPGEVDARRAEAFVADLFELIRSSSDLVPGEFELRIGLESATEDARRFLTRFWDGRYDRDGAREIHRFISVDVTVATDVSIEAVHEQVKEVALDVLSQGGLQNLVLIRNSLDHPGKA
jgi:Putative DNA-binding domain